MAAVTSGQYQPFYADQGKRVTVDAFRMDVYPVSNADYLAFVRNHKRWQRTQIAPLFADEAYLSHWENNLVPGKQAPANAPVTYVSWFAARAYCAAQNKRLPTQDEWEYAAAAGPDQPKPRDAKAFNRRILDWYARPASLPLPQVGHSMKNYWGLWDMHGLVWEWVDDFNALMLTGESRKDAGGLDRQLFCAAGSVGTADPSDYAAFMRYAMRGSVQARHSVQNMGFRCVDNQKAQP